MKTIAQKLHAKAQKARRAGKSKIFKGDIEDLLKNREQSRTSSAPATQRQLNP